MKSNSSHDNRRLKRRKLVYYLELSDCDTGLSLGRIADISAQGIMVIGKEQADAGRSYEVSVALPEEILGKKQAKFTTQCLWCKPDISSSSDYQAGYQISNISVDDLIIINKVMMEYGFGD